MDDHRKRVADYTNANLVLALLNLIWVFVAIWNTLGFAAVLLLAAILNHLITRLEIVRRRRAILSTARGKSVNPPSPRPHG